MTQENGRQLNLAADMYGCPNRCRHCWIGHMPNTPMPEGSDRRIVDFFSPFFGKIAFYSWLREPDYCEDYRGRWFRDLAVSKNAKPQRYELASFYRIVRDERYIPFLKEVGVSCVQLTFFGMENMTDRYVGRKGAFRELLKATDLLLENGISPRWQTFINEENKEELVELLHLSEEMGLAERCKAFGGVFRFFVHAGTCDGENRKLYPIRICKEHIPERLIPHFLDLEENRPEREWCELWKEDTSHVILHNEERIVLYVGNRYDLFFNFTHMRPEWRIGNLKKDPIEELVRRILEEDIPALNTARKITLGELVRQYGNPASERLFEEEDFKIYLLSTHLERNLMMK